MDVSKQAIGSIFIHFWNIGLSILFARKLEDSSDTSNQSDECAFYFLSFLFDTIFGIFFVWALLKMIKMVALSYRIESITVQGYYGNPPSINWYLGQLLCFLLAIMGSKIIITLLMYSIAALLQNVGNLIFQSIQMNPKNELLIVMIVCPFSLNIIQYWLYDNFLSKNLDAPRGPLTENYESLD